MRKCRTSCRDRAFHSIFQREGGERWTERKEERKKGGAAAEEEGDATRLVQLGRKEEMEAVANEWQLERALLEEEKNGEQKEEDARNEKEEERAWGKRRASPLGEKRVVAASPQRNACTFRWKELAEQPPSFLLPGNGRTTGQPVPHPDRDDAASRKEAAAALSSSCTTYFVLAHTTHTHVPWRVWFLAHTHTPSAPPPPKKKNGLSKQFPSALRFGMDSPGCR